MRIRIATEGASIADRMLPFDIPTLAKHLSYK
jgi:hypothetical protein